MKVDFLLAGQPCNPVDRKNIILEINHDQGAVIDQPYPNVGVKNLIFALEDVQRIMLLLNQPPGITEGIPFDIVATERGQTETINMYLKCSDGFKRSKQGISTTIKMLQSLDWLDDIVQSFTLESLYNDTTSLTNFKVDGINYTTYQDYFDKRCIFIPYVISTIPNGLSAFMALFSMTYIVIQIKQAIKQFIQWCTPIAGVTPSVGISQVVLEIVFFAAMLLSLVALIANFFNCLLQPIKYHGAMLVVDMLKIIATKCGLILSSSIWNSYPYNQIAYLPEKYNPVEDANPSINSLFGISFSGFARTGFTSPGYATAAAHTSNTSTIQKGYYNGLGSDFLKMAKTFCNGKIIIPNQTTDLVLERRDNYSSVSNFQLPNVRQDWNGFNTDELSATIEVRFADDLNDKNCIQFTDRNGNKFYSGTILQATHQQITTNNVLMSCLTGLRTIQIQAARGVAKDRLNMIEVIHKDLYSAFHLVANVGIVAINVAIVILDALILVIDILISIFNLLMDAIIAIIKLLDEIINAISALFSGHGIVKPPDWIPVNNNWVKFIALIPLLPVNPSSYNERIGALLLENDMVTTPKLLLVDTNQKAFTDPGGYSGQKRIAYLHSDNAKVINAGWLWDKFYVIDAFEGAINNRQTKIIPALNKDSDANPIILSLSDIKELIDNAKFKDNFSEEVLLESAQCRIGDDTGRTEMKFRKAGWLDDPQNPNGLKRGHEININLQLSISLPNGQ